MNGILKPDVITHKQSTLSAEEYAQEYGEPEMIYGVFWGNLTCSNCDTPCAVAGDMRLDYIGTDEDGNSEYGYYLNVKFFNPSLRLIDFPAETPKPFINTINEASAVLFANPDAAANRVRVSIDVLLTELKVPRQKLNKVRKQVKIETHSRINVYRKKNPEAADYLEAAKWMGNDGSHETGLTVDNVLDGLEALQYALDRIYSSNAKKLAARVKKINARKTIKSPKIRQSTT
jgi:hypothetical protein